MGLQSVSDAKNKKINTFFYFQKYIDCLQNRFGQTIVAPYSVRPREGAYVSTPLEWSEVNAKLKIQNFTIKTVLKRLKKKDEDD
jgi:bifunctional non-homologous end joining protein LigD